MKELSIEEKAQAYDNIIKRLKDFRFEYRLSAFSDAINEHFPELKESEDNRIRQSIISYFKRLLVESSKQEFNAFITKNFKEYINWLENQVNKDEEILILKDQIESLHAAIKAVKETHKIELEKQGVQKLDGTFINVDDVREDFINEVYRVLDADSTNDRANQIIDAFDNLPTITIEKQGEKKPANKVKPKFKVDDWVIRNDIVGATCFCITQIQEPYYYLTNNNNFITFMEEDKYRLWTIKDAKDGDVLCSNQIIILFKQWEDNSDCNFVIAHAGIDISGNLQITDGHWLISNESKPATKEQRDLLFKKIKEAGYEWDAEKKELKKR